MRLPSSSHQSSPSSDPKHAGVHLSGQQLEIFPLHPGTNPARPQDNGRRANRSRGLSPAHSAGRCSASQRVLDRTGTDQRCPRHRTQQPCCTGFVAHWSVAQEAWKAVEKFRATRHGVATVVQQGIAAAILQPETEENQQQLTVVEQVLAMAGFLVAVALVLSAI